MTYDGASDPDAEEARALVHAVKDYAIFLLDPEGRVVSWNLGAQAIKQWQPDEIIGKHFSLFYTPEEQRERKPERLLEIARRGGRVEDEGWRLRKDGTRFWADVVITAVRHPDGSLRGFAKVTRDLTRQHTAELALKQSEASLSATLYSIGDAVIAADARGCVTRLNPVAERLTGWKQAEAVGHAVDSVFRIVNEHSRKPVASPVVRVLAEGVVVGLANHTALLARDGKEYPIADSGAPIRDPSGATLGVVLVFRDVTEERRTQNELRASEAKLRSMISSVRDYAIFLLNVDGCVSSWSPGAEAIYGYPENEVIGRHFSSFYPPDDVASDKPARELATVSERGRVEDEGWRVRKDGSSFWANVIISAVHGELGEPIGYAKVTRDMTERREEQAQVLAAERAATEERLNAERAQAAVRERDIFLSIAAHELRTPLTALQLKLQGLERLVPQTLDQSPLSAKVQSRCRDAIRQTNRLTDLVERLLDVSRIAAGRFPIEREALDLAALLGDVVKDFHENAREQRTEIRVFASGDANGEWDRRRLEQVLLNLLSNAVKYGEGRPVDISLTAVESEVRLTVVDRGIGIAAADLPRIFEPFERAAPLEHYGGLGLGLYIARHIVEAHGGRIDVSSELGNGTRVELTLKKRNGGTS